MTTLEIAQAALLLIAAIGGLSGFAAIWASRKKLAAEPIGIYADASHQLISAALEQVNSLRKDLAQWITQVERYRIQLLESAEIASKQTALIIELEKRITVLEDLLRKFNIPVPQEKL